jgi:ADP-heptose:LPS heptosyltransferase
VTHILVARLDNDGDVLLAGPAIRAIAGGADRVTLLCGPRGRNAAALLPGVAEILVWRAPWIDPEPDPVDPADVEGLVARLRGARIDRAVILGSFHQSPLPTALVLRLAGIGHVAATSADYPGSLLDVRHRISEDVHEVERSLDLVQALGYRLRAADDGALRILRPAAGRPTGAFAGDYVVVHPGASVPARAWEPELCAELVQLLAQQGRRVVVTGGPAERELTACVAGPPRPGVLDLGGETTLAELAEVLAAADTVVVGNTGPAHLAAAVGTPVVSLFAPTVPPVRWRPWKVPHELLSIDVPCAGCRARECPVPGHPCLSRVAPADVARAVERLACPVRVEAAA